MPEDFENFDLDDVEEPKKRQKIQLKKEHIKIILGVLILGIIGYLIYTQVYLKMLPRNVNIVCETKNGYEIKCPDYIIYDSNGKVVDIDQLKPGKYKIVFKPSQYTKEKKEKLYVSDSWDQTKTFIFDDLDIVKFPKVVYEYPRISTNVEIILKNNLHKIVPYEIKILDENGNIINISKGYIKDSEKTIKIPVIFCESTKDVCLNDKDNLTSYIVVNYGPIQAKKNFTVILYDDPEIEIDGDFSVDLSNESPEIKKIYTITLDKDSPAPIFNMSIDIYGIEPFVKNLREIETRKITLYPGKSVEIPIIFKYAETTLKQRDFEGSFKIKKDLYEKSEGVRVYLEQY